MTAVATHPTAEGPITLTRMANLAAMSIIGNNTAAPTAPTALAIAQVLGMGGLATNVTATKTLTLAAAIDATLTVAGASVSVAGTNTGDVTLATNHGLSLTNQVIGMGTPSTCTATSTNAVTTTTHTHAITASTALVAPGSAQYQVLTAGATPFAATWSGWLYDGTTGGKLTAAITSGKVVTLTATDNSGLTFTGAAVLTVPATGTAVLAQVATAEETWIGPSSTAGVYFKGGNVGIGTTNPLAKLHTNFSNVALGASYNTFGDGFFSSNNTASPTGKGGSISLGGIFNGSTYGVFGRIHGKQEGAGGTPSGFLAFETSAVNGGSFTQFERMRITSSGNVGIGTTVPLAKLGVLGNLSVGGTYGAIAAPVGGAIIEGKVGIGTSAAIAANTFVWINSSSTVISLRYQNSSTDALVTWMENTSANRAWSFGVAGSANGRESSGSFYIRDETAGVSAHDEFTIAPATGQVYMKGNVGIGQASPGAKLSVSGGGAFGSTYSTTAVSDGNLIISGNVGIGTTLADTTHTAYTKLTIRTGSLLFTGQSASAFERPLFSIAPSFVVNTDASRTTRATFNVADAAGGTAAAREFMCGEASGSAPMISFLGAAAVARPAALTAALTVVSSTAPGTPDYAIADPVQNTGYGFSTADEFLTAMAVLANLQNWRNSIDDILGHTAGYGLITH